MFDRSEFSLSKRPRISIIVPVFNVARYVGPCIASIRAQTFADFEAIVVDDGSTDTSRSEIWAAIDEDPRFRVITRANGGLSAARNTGLERVRGDFIAFVDSDDRIAPNYLFDLFAAVRRTGADWAACAVRFCLPDGSTHDHTAIHGVSFPAAASPRTKVFALRDWGDVIPHFPSAWNKLYRRRLVEGLRFIEGIYYEDHPYFYDVACRTNRLAYVPQPLYWQTQGRAGQITAEGSDRVFEQFRILDEIRSRMTDDYRPGRKPAFARIATRLIYERSLPIADPDLRDRYIAACSDYFRDNGLEFDGSWDSFIDPLWGWRIAGRLALSIVVQVRRHETDALIRTLQALSRLPVRDFETIVVPAEMSTSERDRIRALVGTMRDCKVVDRVALATAGTKAAGLVAAKGAFAMFLNAGDRVATPGSLRPRLVALARGDPDPAFAEDAQKTGEVPNRIWRWQDLMHHTLPDRL
ncbi:glycosyltransferase family 2 protein [Tropicimonas marinistellae]|uniref:glycosyltransferase family 2 protein n=1 Tax=Tropicimonas marinistellae TaxID=1739787 RepID=UPI000836B81E|nr:glycosyltransferase [Tropicimonas marinistellae]